MYIQNNRNVFNNPTRKYNDTYKENYNGNKLLCTLKWLTQFQNLNSEINCLFLLANKHQKEYLLINTIIDQQLSDQGCQESNSYSKAKTTSRSIKRPPQSNGECSQCERQLYVVIKIHFLRSVLKSHLLKTCHQIIPTVHFSKIRCYC